MGFTKKHKSTQEMGVARQERKKSTCRCTILLESYKQRTLVAVYCALTCWSAWNDLRGLQRTAVRAPHGCSRVSGHGSSNSVTGCDEASTLGQHAYARFRHTATSVSRAGSGVPYSLVTFHAVAAEHHQNAAATVDSATKTCCCIVNTRKCTVYCVCPRARVTNDTVLYVMLRVRGAMHCSSSTRLQRRNIMFVPSRSSSLLLLLFFRNCCNTRVSAYEVVFVSR